MDSIRLRFSVRQSCPRMWHISKFVWHYRITMKISILLFIVLLFSGCYTKVSDFSNSEDKQLILSEDYILPSRMDFEDYKTIPFLFHEWVHSREEEKDSIKIYRPSASRSFPPSRFREIIEFYKDGKFKYLFLDPYDAHYFKYGGWALNKQDTSIIGLVYSPQKVNRIKIIQLSNDILSFVSLD